MIQDPLVIDVVFLLDIGKGLISTVSLSIVVHPNPYEVFFVTELVTILGRFLVVFLWGFSAFNVLVFLLFLCFCVGYGGMIAR